MKQFVWYLLGCLVVLAGCSDGETSRRDQEYFPLQTGFYQIYSVEENVYSELNPPEHNLYELKMEVVDSFSNQEGGYTFVIHRSTRPTENDPWVFQEVWSARSTPYQAILTEGNISYLRIAFPAFKNKEWNGNQLNSLEAEMYVMESVGDSYQLETDLEFSDAVVINQENEGDELHLHDREEVYGRNAGLIYKKSIEINYCDKDPCFGQEIIKDGLEYWQTLKEYGQN